STGGSGRRRPLPLRRGDLGQPPPRVRGREARTPQRAGIVPRRPGRVLREAAGGRARGARADERDREPAGAAGGPAGDGGGSPEGPASRPRKCSAPTRASLPTWPGAGNTPFFRRRTT